MSGDRSLIGGKRRLTPGHAPCCVRIDRKRVRDCGGVRGGGWCSGGPSQFGFVVEDDFVFAVEPGEHFADGIKPHDGAAIDAGEEFRVERFFEGVERGAQGVGFCAAMENQIIALGFDPGDFADIHEVGAGFFANEQTIGKSAVAQNLIDQSAQAFFAGVAVFLCCSLCALHDFAEAIFADGLQQIVKGMHFKRAHRVLIVRGDKHKSRCAAAATIAIG